MITVIKAAPCAGKSTIKKHLTRYNVACVDMSELIDQATADNPTLRKMAQEMKRNRQLLPCEIVMNVFTDFVTKNPHDRWAVFGMPRTIKQAEELADHPTFEKFDCCRLIDYFVDIPVLKERYLKRQSNEARVDDQVPWNIFRESRVEPFFMGRHGVLKVFNSHHRWHVGCEQGNAENAAEEMAKHLVKSMRLRLRQTDSIHKPHGKRVLGLHR